MSNRHTRKSVIKAPGFNVRDMVILLLMVVVNLVTKTHYSVNMLVKKGILFLLMEIFQVRKLKAIKVITLIY